MNVSARLVKYFSLSTSTPSISTTTLQNLAANHPKGIAKVVLKKGKTQLFRDGSPMVYSGAVDRILGKPPPKTGDVVLVADGNEKPIAWGLYNSVSMFCVRLMQLEEEATRDPSCALDMENLLEARINASIELRRHLGLPSACTNAYRLVNSEGDRLSGLIVDIFGGLAVVASSAAWVEKYRQQVEDCISRIDGISHINWRPSMEILKEEGLHLPYTKEIILPRHSLERIKVVENGIFYAISLEGQKTGFYVDQRENRQFISTISNGQRVLDLCCYSGGFSLNAACGGAVNVTDIPCGTKGGVMITFEKIEVVNRLRKDYVYETLRDYGVHYDNIWIYDKIHHEINQFCSSHSLQQVYIDLFDKIDETMKDALQADCTRYAPGIEIISVRVTKPSIPESIRSNFERMEEERTKVVIALEKQKVSEKEAETMKMIAISEAQKNAQVSKIQVEQKLREKEGLKMLGDIENEMYTSRQKSLIDASFYQSMKEADANKLKLTPQYLELKFIEAIANNTKIFFGDKVPNLILDQRLVGNYFKEGNSEG